MTRKRISLFEILKTYSLERSLNFICQRYLATKRGDTSGMFYALSELSQSLIFSLNFFLQVFASIFFQSTCNFFLLNSANKKLTCY